MAVERLGPQAFVATKKYEAQKDKNQSRVDFVRSSGKSDSRSFNVSLSRESTQKSADEYEKKQNRIKKNAVNNLKKVDDKMKKDVQKADIEYDSELKDIKREFERGQKEVQRKYDRERAQLKHSFKHVVT